MTRLDTIEEVVGVIAHNLTALADLTSTVIHARQLGCTSKMVDTKTLLCAYVSLQQEKETKPGGKGKADGTPTYCLPFDEENPGIDLVEFDLPVQDIRVAEAMLGNPGMMAYFLSQVPSTFCAKPVGRMLSVMFGSYNTFTKTLYSQG